MDEDGGAGGMTLSQVCKESDIDVIKEEFEDVLPGNTALSDGARVTE